jgi:hypothetical protein
MFDAITVEAHHVFDSSRHRISGLAVRIRRFYKWYRWAVNTPLTEEEEADRQTFQM